MIISYLCKVELHDILTGIYPLPKESIEKIESLADKIYVDRNKEIISADRVCHDVFFVAKGIVRAFYYGKGREITFWIGAEGSVAVSMQSYINGRAGYETIETLEDCILFRLDGSVLQSLYTTDIHIANWGRKFAEKEILKTEKNLIPQLFTTGKERYENLLKEQPELLNRISLENIASYIGITPVSLSRIRSEYVKG